MTIHRRVAALPLVVACVTVALSGCQRHADMWRAEEPFEAGPVRSNAFSCTASHVTESGIWRAGAKPATHYVSVGPDKPQVWDITVRDSSATIVGFDPNLQRILDSEEFELTKPGPGTIKLIAKRKAAESTEIITVDLSNGSFLASNQNATALYNRVAVFYGVCRDK